MNMNKFAKNFMTVLKEADGIGDPDLERDAMENSLDDGTDASEYDTDLTPAPSSPDDVNSQIDDALSQRNQQIISELQTWITEIEKFLNFLNSEDPKSVQSRLSNATPDTIMDKMKQSQQTKISRVAADIAALHQNFLGFMAQTPNPKFKFV